VRAINVVKSDETRRVETYKRGRVKKEIESVV